MITLAPDDNMAFQMTTLASDDNIALASDDNIALASDDNIASQMITFHHS